MTVNELAIASKTDRIHLEPLWLDVYKLICVWARRYIPQDGNTSRYELDDLIQSAYPALLAAVEAYPAGSPYQFTTYLYHHCRRAFREVLGIRTSKREPPLVPLYTPIGDGITIADTIPDEAAAGAFDGVEADIYTAQLRAALDEAIQTLSEPQRDIINGMHFKGRTRKELAAEKGCTYGAVVSHQAQAMRALRRGKAYEMVKGFRYDVYGGSLARFRQTFTSSTEAAVLKLLDLESGLWYDRYDVIA